MIEMIPELFSLAVAAAPVAQEPAPGVVQQAAGSCQCWASGIDQEALFRTLAELLAFVFVADRVRDWKRTRRGEPTGFKRNPASQAQAPQRPEGS